MPSIPGTVSGACSFVRAPGAWPLLKPESWCRAAGQCAAALPLLPAGEKREGKRYLAVSASEGSLPKTKDARNQAIL
eukprot:1161340-Pelagomonas_calceolata.AAC.9